MIEFSTIQSDTHQDLKEQGFGFSKTVVEIITSSLVKHLCDYLITGSEAEIPGLGTIYGITRKVGPQVSEKGVTAKMQVYLNDDFKGTLLDNLLKQQMEVNSTDA